jgi:hypothetical protein
MGLKKAIAILMLTASTASAWHYQVNKDAMTDETACVAVTQGRDGRSILAISKQPDGDVRSLLMLPGIMLKGEYKIRAKMRFDKGEIIGKSWDKSTDPTNAFMPDAEKYVPMLATATTFAVQIEAYNGMRTFVFDLENDGNVQKVLECK